MPCTFCDAPLPPDARYCPQCGVSVGPGQSDRFTAADPTYAKPDPGYVDEDFGPAAPAAGVTTSKTAIISLVCGIAAWTLLPAIGAILAIVTGHQARREIEQSRGTLEGDNLALVGLVLGYLQVVPILLALLVMLGALFFTVMIQVLFTDWF